MIEANGDRIDFYADFYDAAEIYDSFGITKSQALRKVFKGIHPDFGGMLTITPVRTGKGEPMSWLDAKAAEAKGQIKVDPSDRLADFLLLNAERPPGGGIYHEAQFEISKGRITGIPPDLQEEAMAMVGFLKLVGATPAKEDKT